jgi:hypothetical protein
MSHPVVLHNINQFFQSNTFIFNIIIYIYNNNIKKKRFLVIVY